MTDSTEPPPDMGPWPTAADLRDRLPALRPLHGPITIEGLPPAQVIAQAQEAATALQSVISQKPRKLVFNNRQYIEFEDWQLVGHFYGVTAQAEGEPEYVAWDVGGRTVWGFRAVATALHHGQVVSRASAMCMTDEDKWSVRPKYAWRCKLVDGTIAKDDDPPRHMLVWIDHPKKPGQSIPDKVRVQVGDESVPLFQMASMAQTRASAKALSNVLRWVVALAGYGTTPAEEIEDREPRPTPARAAVEGATQRSKPPTPTRPAGATREQRREVTVPPVEPATGPLGPEPPPVGEPDPAGGQAAIRSRSVQRREATQRGEPAPTFVPDEPPPAWAPTPSQVQSLLVLLDSCGISHWRSGEGARETHIVRMPPHLGAVLVDLPEEFALRDVHTGAQWINLLDVLHRHRRALESRPVAAGGTALPAAASTSPSDDTVPPPRMGAAVTRPAAAASAAPGRDPIKPKARPANQQDVPF